jgi:transposase
MPPPTPFPIRQALIHAHQQGADIATLAQRFDLSPRTARRLLSQALPNGQARPPAYHCGPRPSSLSPVLVAQACALRQQHTGWGAGLIRLTLAHHYPDVSLPCVQTIRRWLARANLAPAPPGRLPSAYQRATQVHELWQADAADQMPLATGKLTSWLRLVDECSGAVLRTTVFPPSVQPGQRHPGAGLPA